MNLRFDSKGNEIDSVEDRILMWASLVAFVAVSLGGIVYYNVGMNRSAQPVPQWTSVVSP
jgi:hypothetical protein